MRFDLISDWLKSSVPGVIVLGSVGSLIAALLLNLGRRLLLELLPARYKALRALLTRDAYVGGYIMGFLDAKRDLPGHFTYFAAVICKFSLALATAHFFGIAFLLIRYSQPNQELTPFAYAVLVASFLSLFYAAAAVRPVVRAYIHLISPVVQLGYRSFSDGNAPVSPSAAAPQLTASTTEPTPPAGGAA